MHMHEPLATDQKWVQFVDTVIFALIAHIYRKQTYFEAFRIYPWYFPVVTNYTVQEKFHTHVWLCSTINNLLYLP